MYNIDYILVLLFGVWGCIVLFLVCFLCNIAIDIADNQWLQEYPDLPENEMNQAIRNPNASFNGMELLQIVPAHRSMLGVDQIMSGSIADNSSLRVFPDDHQHETIQRTHSTSASLNAIKVLPIVPTHRRLSA